MRLTVIEECPHCSKRLAGALDHWSKMFMDGGVDDDFADEISEILSEKSHSLKSNSKKIEIMYLVQPDIERLSDICQWILHHDENLPNRDGNITGEVVTMAHEFYRDINKNDLAEVWDKS
jgi:hypothetical protein